MDGWGSPPPVVHCSGDGLSRGLAHGKSIRNEVRAAVRAWEESITARTGLPSREAVSALLDGTELVSSITSQCPDLLEEVRGIARGANLDMRTVLAYNLMDEEWWFFRDLPRGVTGCTVVARMQPRHRTGTPRVVLGQTMDLPAAMDGSQIVLRIRDGDAPEALVLSAAGMIGLAGANSAGVSVCVNTLSMLEHSGRGLPVAFVLRLLLRCNDVPAADAVLRGVAHASGQQYLVADAYGMRGFECSATGVWEWTGPNEGYVAHTNHVLSDAPVDEAVSNTLVASGYVASSQRRLDFATAQRDVVQSASDVKGVLADRTTPICVRADGGRGSITFAAVVFEAAIPPAVEMCLGQPDRTPWVTTSGQVSRTRRSERDAYICVPSGNARHSWPGVRRGQRNRHRPYVRSIPCAVRPPRR